MLVRKAVVNWPGSSIWHQTAHLLGTLLLTTPAAAVRSSSPQGTCSKDTYLTVFLVPSDGPLSMIASLKTSLKNAISSCINIRLHFFATSARWIAVVVIVDLNTSIRRLLRFNCYQNHEDAIIFCFCEYVVTVSGLQLAILAMRVCLMLGTCRNAFARIM